MQSVRIDFDEKKKEAGILLSLVEELSVTPRSIEKTSIVKSAFIVLLYNMTESTLVAILEEIHEKLKRCPYKDLSNVLQTLYVDFYFGKAQTKANLKSLNATLFDDLRFPNFHDFSNRIRLFSGNLDVRSVNEILKKYGIAQIRPQNSSAVLLVKNKRNKIAHGEEMMKDSCRGMTCRELESLREAIDEFLGKVIDSVELYLSEKKYKLS
ncbi:MAE_28990/MAE_18760 family HEPN-like nuclease [Halomonas colorata]|uniref:MAE-28990/MAE-18760-like HEPN domain-containing protein n=1 Tax=Halomonas colorata TaxID=2742615 RepID=A0ABR9G3N4_9GAMM|nr:MAE_28990/MAE_18760 family HEPN-like nuclease [Halomonas colorata]MBE0465518.1 hypothetical protein [Halomonas colorata]